MSLAGQWDAVNGQVLRSPVVQPLEHHCHQLKSHSVTDVEISRFFAAAFSFTVARVYVHDHDPWLVRCFSGVYMSTVLQVPTPL